MSEKLVADEIVEALEKAGVQRIYGVVGDSLNGITNVLLKKKSIRWMHTRHEEAAAFAAGAEAALTGELAVCAGSCGPGNLHLINGLYDCHRNRVPVLAIAAHIPSEEIGSEYFQETQPQFVFKECSDFCELVSDARQMPRLLNMAIQTAIVKKGVAVLVISGDVALEAAQHICSVAVPAKPNPQIIPSEAELKQIAEMLNHSKKTTVLCGSGCKGAHDELMQLCEQLKAPTVHALRGKEYVEYDNPFDVGMTGLIGFSSGYYAMESCDTLLILGSSFPYRQFYPTDAKIIQVDIDGTQLGRRCHPTLGVIGDVKATIEALLPQLNAKKDDTHLKKALDHYRKARRGLDELAVPDPGAKRVHSQYVAKMISQLATDDAIFTCDVGTPTVWAARYFQMNGRRRLLGSFNHGSMANALSQAIGAQSVDPKRQVIALCGDGGFTMLMGDFISLTQLELPVKVVIINNGALGFVELEMKANGYLETGTDLKNPNFADMGNAMGIHSVRVEDPGDLEKALTEAFNHPGPALVDVVTYRMELVMPPAISTAQMAGFTLYMSKAIMSGRGDELVELAKTNLWR